MQCTTWSCIPDILEVLGQSLQKIKSTGNISLCQCHILAPADPPRGSAKINGCRIRHPFGHYDLMFRTHSLRCNLWIVWLLLAYRTPQSSTLSLMATAGGYCAGNHHDPPVSIDNQLTQCYLHQSYWWDWGATSLEGRLQVYIHQGATLRAICYNIWEWSALIH